MRSSATLFLSADPTSVKGALEQGFPAALVLSPPDAAIGTDREVRVAFDGDGVLFDEESDRIYRTEGAEAYFRHEKANADVPLSAGPFKPFLTALAAIQAQFKEGAAPIRTAIVTARNAPAHFRVVNTFRAWGVQVDEGHFVGPADKSKFVSRLRPHIFLDDRLDNLVKAARDVPAAQIPSLGAQIELFGSQPAAVRPPIRKRSAQAKAKGSEPARLPSQKSGESRDQARPLDPNPGRGSSEPDALLEPDPSRTAEPSRTQ